MSIFIGLIIILAVGCGAGLATAAILRLRVFGWKSYAKELEGRLTEPESVTIERAKNSELVATCKHWAVRLMATSFVETLRELGGENFVTMECGPDEKYGERMVVTIRRKSGKTPEELWVAAKNEVERLRAELEEVRK